LFLNKGAYIGAFIPLDFRLSDGDSAEIEAGPARVDPPDAAVVDLNRAGLKGNRHAFFETRKLQKAEFEAVATGMRPPADEPNRGIRTPTLCAGDGLLEE